MKKINESNLAFESAETLKKGGVVLYPSPVGWLLAGNYSDSRVIEKFNEIIDHELDFLLIINKDFQLNFLLKDIPHLAYDIFDQSEKPLIILFDEPLNHIEKFLNQNKKLAVCLLKDDLSWGILNKGIKVLSCIRIPGKLNNIPPLPESALAGIDYVVNLPASEFPAFTEPSVIGLKVNGEVKVIKK